MKTLTLVGSSEQIKQIKLVYSDEIDPTVRPFIDFLIKTDQCTITVYHSKKIVIQGEQADYHAFLINNLTQNTQNIMAHAGSDEVGTGDYFGPICVCATYVDHQSIKWLNTLSIIDSKQLTDAQINAIAPQLIAKLPYSLLILTNEQYNQTHQKYNLNAIKAKLHNQAYLHLAKKCQMNVLGIIDQFTPAATYFKYLKDEKEVYTHVEFHTKAENQFLAVACAAIIARHAFLEALKQLEIYLQLPLPKGASAAVDQAAAQIVRKYDFNKLNMVAKIHFKNTEKIKALLDDSL